MVGLGWLVAGAGFEPATFKLSLINIGGVTPLSAYRVPSLVKAESPAHRQPAFFSRWATYSRRARLMSVW